MPAGRKEIQIDIAKIEAYAARGLTEQQIADALGISIDTLTRRKRKYKHFAEAIKKGKAKGIGLVTNALFEQACAGNVAACFIYLKNRAGWKDKPDEAPSDKIPEIHIHTTD